MAFWQYLKLLPSFSLYSFDHLEYFLDFQFSFSNICQTLWIIIFYWLICRANLKMVAYWVPFQWHDFQIWENWSYLPILNAGSFPPPRYSTRENLSRNISRYFFMCRNLRIVNINTREKRKKERHKKKKGRHKVRR